MISKFTKSFFVASVSLMLALPSYSAQAEDLDYHQGGYTFPGELVLTATLASEYTFRGIAYSNEEPAYQGSLQYNHDSNFYIGVWASTVDLGTRRDEVSSEVDFYAGMLFDLGAGVTWDLGATYYFYPGSSDIRNSYNFYEYRTSLQKDFEVFDAKAGVHYAPNFFGDSGNSVYSFIDTDIPIYDELYGELHYGYQTIAREQANFGYPNYGEWSAGLGYDVYGFNLKAFYHDTDLDENTCNDRCNGSITFSVGRSFQLWDK